MKKIFFDESNTSGSYIDANNKAIISATGYWEDEYINNKAMEITNGKEIKGSDLYTKSNTKLRKNIIKILSKDGKKRFSSFVKNHYMSTSFSATYDALCVYDLNQFLNEEGKAKLFKFQQILSILATKNSKEELVLIQEELNNERNYEIIIKYLKKIAYKNDLEKEFNFWFNLQKKYIDKKVMHEQINKHEDILMSNIMNVAMTLGGELKIIVDIIPDESQKKLRLFEQESYLTQKFFDIKIEFKDSKKEIGIQIADWFTSLFRKTIKILIEDLNVIDNEIKDKEDINFLIEVVNNYRKMFRSHFNSNMQIDINSQAYINVFTKKPEYYIKNIEKLKIDIIDEENDILDKYIKKL